MYSVLSVALCTLCMVQPLSALAQTVFGSSSSGTFWGINIDPDAATVKYPLYPGYVRSTGSMSYDAHSGQSLFEHFAPNTLAYGPMCSNSPGLTPKFLFNITDALLERPDLGDVFTGIGGAFAMHRSKIYFLHYGSYESETLGTIHRFEVRVLQSCEDCGVDPYAEDNTGSMSMSMLYTVQCSKVVAELPNVVNGFDEVPTEYHLGTVLKVVGSEEADLTFYFQIGRFSYKDDEMNIEMLMYKLAVGSKYELIHTQKINNSFRKWNLHLIGAVDYLNGMLCWTTADRMLCRFKEGDQPKTIVQPGTAVGKGICTGTSAQHLNDISGVSILQTDSKRVVLFGCSPQTANVSGAGLVEIDSEGMVTKITAFKAEDELLSAASLVTVKSLPSECSFTPRPVLCVRLQRVTTETVPQIPTLPTTAKPEVEPEVEPEVPKPDGEKGNEVDNEPSGEPGATEEDNLVDNSEAVVGGDGSESSDASPLQSAAKHTLLQMFAVIAGCLLLS